MSQPPRRLRLGIVTNELLAPELSPLGGFGYAASSVARLFSSEPSLGVDVTVLACSRMNVPDDRTTAVSDGAEVLIRPPNPDRWRAMLLERRTGRPAAHDRLSTLLRHRAGDVRAHAADHVGAGSAKLMNSSIHEALPVSFLEALAHQLPIISSVNPGGVVSSFGIHVPMSNGDGLASVPLYVAAVRRLIADRVLAERLGRTGREWLAAHHGTAPFLAAFASTCDRLGVPVPVPSASVTASTV